MSLKHWEPMSALLELGKGWLNAGLGFLYPEACQLCGERRATPEECFICEQCKARVRWIEPPFCERCGYPYQGAISVKFECANCRDTELHFSSARSAVLAGEEMLEVIHRYKYQRAFWFEPFLAGLLTSRASAELAKGNWDWIVPVPLHPARQREREFNQAEHLARRLALATGIPVNDRLLRRVVQTRTQTLLSRPERLANVRKAFCLRGRESLDGQRIVLVDDVFTTGATTSACARVLRAGGAGNVCVWTVARGI